MCNKVLDILKKLKNYLTYRDELTSLKQEKRTSRSSLRSYYIILKYEVLARETNTLKTIFIALKSQKTAKLPIGSEIG